MNFLNLKYFVVAAEEMNFTRAAKRLYISQQSLSNHISKLEDDFGVKLFERNSPMTLTDAGQSLFRNATKLLNLKQETELEIQDIKDFKNAILTVGVLNTRGAIILPKILMRFRQEFPQVKINLVEGNSEEIMDALYKGKVDFSIGFEVDDPEKVTATFLQEVYVMIVVPDNIFQGYFTPEEQQELLKQKSLPISAFRHCPFIKMKHMNWIGTVFEDCCSEAGMIPNVVLETVNIMTMVSLCAAGYGIIVVSGSFVDQDSPVFNCAGTENTHVFHLDFPNAHTRIAANFLKNKYQTKAAMEFIKLLKEILGNS